MIFLGLLWFVFVFYVSLLLYILLFISRLALSDVIILQILACFVSLDHAAKQIQPNTLHEFSME